MSNQEDPANKDLQSIAGGAGLSVLGRIVNGALSFLYGVVIARLLDVHSVGVVMLALTVIRIAEFVARMGLELGTLHFVAILAGKGDVGAVRATVRNAVRLVLVSSVVLALILAWCAAPLSALFTMPDFAPVIRILSVSLVPTSVTMVLLAALLALKRFGDNTLCERIVLPAANLVICSILLLAGFGIVGAGVAYVAAALIALPMAARFFQRSMAAAGHAGTAVRSRELLRFSAPVLLVIVLTQLLFWVDIVMLGLLRNASEVGVYSAAARTAFVANMIVAAAGQIFAPTISNLHSRGELAQLQALYKTVGKWTFLVTAPVVALLLLLSGEILQAFGPAFTAGKTALVILALSQLVDASTGASTFMLTMSGRLRLMIINTGTALGLNIALNAWLVPRHGIDGAAMATFLALATFQLMALIQTRLTLGMHPYGFGYLKPLAAGVAAFAAVVFLKAAVGPLPYLLAIVVYAAAYLLLYSGLLAVAGIDKKDRLVVDAVLGKLRSVR